MSSNPLIGLLTDRAVSEATVKVIRERVADCVPDLIDALESPRVWREYSEAQLLALGIFKGGRRPVEIVLGCLAKAAADGVLEEVPERVRELARHEDKSVRKEAGAVVGAIASDHDIELLRVLMADPDSYVRSAVARGIAAGAGLGRGSRGFRDAMFEAVSPDALSWQNARIAAGCLLELDRERAIGFLTSPACMDATNSATADVLRVLREAGARVLIAPLLDLIATCESDAAKYPHDRVMGEAILLVESQDQGIALGVAERHVASSGPDTRKAAAKALCLLAGITDPYGVMDAAYRSGREAAMTEQQLNVGRVRWLIDQVTNGGFSQYFVNGYGEDWRRTLVALDAIGAPNCHLLLTAAALKFGPSGPDPTRYDDHVVEFHRAHDDDVWNAEDSEFLKDPDDIEVLLHRYMLVNAPHFRGTGAAKQRET